MLNKKLKSWFGWRGYVILLIGLILLGIVHHSLPHYWAGVRGNAFDAFPYVIFSSPLLILMSFISFLLALCLLLDGCRNKKVAWLKILYVTLPIQATLIVFVCGFFIQQPGAVYFLRGYENWVARKVDIPTVRAWLAALPKDYFGQRYLGARDFPGELPEAITAFNPHYMNLGKFEEGHRSVEFEWGCAFGHFGFVIGPPEMKTPEKEEMVIIHESLYEFRRPIEPGVYLFDRG